MDVSLKGILFGRKPEYPEKTHQVSKHTFSHTAAVDHFSIFFNTDCKNLNVLILKTYPFLFQYWHFLEHWKALQAT